MGRFIAHIVMHPNDGGSPYTVETEFKANSYPQAWEHISRLGLRFDAKIASHRIQQLAAKEGDEAEPLLLPGPPPPAAAVASPTLTVNAEAPVASVPKFYREATFDIPEVIPFPHEEEAVHDPAAA